MNKISLALLALILTSCASNSATRKIASGGTQGSGGAAICRGEGCVPVNSISPSMNCGVPVPREAYTPVVMQIRNVDGRVESSDAIEALHALLQLPSCREANAPEEHTMLPLNVPGRSNSTFLSISPAFAVLNGRLVLYPSFFRYQPNVQAFMLFVASMEHQGLGLSQMKEKVDRYYTPAEQSSLLQNIGPQGLPF